MRNNSSSHSLSRQCPGMVFKLTESSLCGAIEAVGRTNKQLGLEDNAGKLQFWFDSDPIALANQVLGTYYADI
ncbi:DUF4007 family protein [Synechocystis salina]|uniref:DUF4007 family protein n=1 Tax=Synechocystis salina TaxID=945780 RepID=UPI00223F099C|nr:DUF4007 family protein [Synechocystis salina]